MTVVVDASVALKWVFQEEHTDEALSLWDHWQKSTESVVAPPLYRAEVTNVLYHHARRGHITSVHATDVLDTLLSIVAVVEPDGLYARAFALAGMLVVGSTYDAMYLALAESEQCEMWTADLRFVRSAQGSFPRVRWIGEIA